jgi:hypothetical protein
VGYSKTLSTASTAQYSGSAAAQSPAGGEMILQGGQGFHYTTAVSLGALLQ